MSPHNLCGGKPALVSAPVITAAPLLVGERVTGVLTGAVSIIGGLVALIWGIVAAVRVLRLGRQTRGGSLTREASSGGTSTREPPPGRRARD